MLIIAIESATNEVSCALGDEQELIATFSLHRQRQHVETLVPAIAFLLQRANYARSDITHVAVDVGPGLFTGLRVGVGTARALAIALDVPMVGVTSLDVLCAPWQGGFPVAGVLDAKRGEVYWQAYPGDSKIHLDSPRNAATAIAALGSDVTVIGETDLLVGEASNHIRVMPPSSPQASGVLQVAQQSLREGLALSPSDIEVHYLRKSDAEINRDEAAAKKR